MNEWGVVSTKFSRKWRLASATVASMVGFTSLIFSSMLLILLL